MKILLLELTILLYACAFARGSHDLLDQIPQYSPNENYADVSEDYAEKRYQEHQDDLAKALKKDPQNASKINNRSLDLIFRWYTMGARVVNDTQGLQLFQVKLMNRHPEWVPMILEGCRRPIFQAFSPVWDERYDSENAVFQPPYFNSIEMLPYHEGCTWENSREVYRRLLEQYRTVRQYLNHSDWMIQRFNKARQEVSATDPVGSLQENYLRWMLRSIPGVLARFPTREGVEELCQQLEAPPGWNTLAAANALSVCTSEETLPRVKAAFEKARRIRLETGETPADSYQNPLEYQRLAARLADVKADLSGMMEGAGFRLIKPDWRAARDTDWNQIPPVGSALRDDGEQSRPMLAASQNKTSGWSWLWVLLIPITWMGRGAWDRHVAKRM